MTIVYRSVKGSNLTADEVDGNFHDLDDRVTELETNPPVANGVANVIVEGSVWYVVLDDATELGPFQIPVATPRPSVTLDYADAELTVSLAHGLRYIRCSHVDGCVVTFELDSVINHPTDNEVHFCQRSGNSITFIPGGTDGPQLNFPEGFGNTTAGMGAVVTAKKVGPDEWDIFGLLTEEEATA